MRLINKRPEPTCIAQHRSAGGSYDELEASCKQNMRDALLLEQCVLCCYCMSRIKSTQYDMKVEHWVPQTAPDGKSLTLKWTNLLGACKGSEGQAPQNQHCDTAKADKTIALTPLQSSCESLVEFGANGRIFSKHPNVQADLDTLNLNAEKLIAARKAAIEGVLDVMKREKSHGTWTRERVERKIEHVQTPTGNALTPYVQAIVYFLRRHHSFRNP